MKAYRAAILRFATEREPHHAAIYEEDGLLMVGSDARGAQVVQAVGSYRDLKGQFAGVATEHLPGRIIAPGFVDMHMHYPQTNLIGSPAEGLLPWLENYTFPEKKRFSDPNYSA